MSTKAVGVALIVVTAACLGASALAWHYRGRALHFERQWTEARAQLDRAAVATTDAEAASRDDSAQAPRRWSDRTMVAAPRPAEVEALALADEIAPAAPPAPAPSTSPRERDRRGSEDWMERMRTNDPQRYAEFEQHRQEMMQAVQAAWSQKTNYFGSRDTSRMTESELAEYNLMLSLLNQTWSLGQQLRAGLPSELRHEAMSTVRSNIVALMPLLNNERDREYYDLAVSMGHNAEEASAFVSYVNAIASNTSMRAVLPPGVMGGRGGFGGFGGFGGQRNRGAAPSN